MTSKSVLELKELYIKQAESQNHAGILNTIFTRFLVPMWGGNKPKGARANNKDIEYASNYLKQISLDQLTNITQEFEKLLIDNNVASQTKRVYRFALRRFLDWIAEQNLSELHQKSEEIEPQKEKLSLKSPAGSPRADWQHYSPHKIKFKKPYTLCVKDNKGNLIYPNDYINPQLAIEIEDFQKHRAKVGCSLGTIKTDVQRIKQLLGWLHRHKEIPLDKLSLTNLFTHSTLYVTGSRDQDEDNISDYLLKQHKSKQFAEKNAMQSICLIDEYFEFLKCHPRTEGHNLTTFTAIAKFVYKNELAVLTSSPENEIPIFRQLKLLAESIDKRTKITPPTVPFISKSVPWEVVIQVLERLRTEASEEVFETNRRSRRNFYYSIQTFLSLAFMTVIPPLRPRVFYELELGETLVKGIYKNSIFIPASNLKNPDEALWYIHLMPHQYKTGKIYGEWWSTIPNVEFPNGKKLYSYIDVWLKDGRNYGRECNHNYFFRRKQTYEQLNSHAWRQRLERAFFRLTGVPVSPKELRKIYVTFLKDSGATEVELEAAAIAMQHSRKMQSTIYDQQTQQNKIAPMLAFNERKLKEIWAKLGELTFNSSTITATNQVIEKRFTRLNLLYKEAINEVNRLRKVNMTNEQIIHVLWDATPVKRSKYQEAIAELEELTKG
ncbi:MAG: hypothetical protein RMY64_25590 [Nostoc sp. DedQUE08]|uniref:hypothetical protein n=1 Tax=Nostoc sp. DedQUE08 TaxID=3075393 RepID=UPI002AD2E018|nr:hypothetical protein [Nostoc sp. DedQUE08]MDZ8068968.1 hypothetical protein [Nostoc sp. DedQUE08]